MSPRTRFPLILAVLLLASLACEYLPSLDSASQADAEGAIATSVAATIAAGEAEEISPDLPADPEPTGEILLAPTHTPEAVVLGPLPLKVVYIKDGNLWYWEEGILPYSLSPTGDAYGIQLSDDANVVAFTRGPDRYHQELWAINTDGSNLRQLVDQATLATYITHQDALSARIFRFKFKPGTHQVAFNTQLTFEGPGLILNDDLRIVDADTTALATVLPPGSGGSFYYSPDGSLIGLATPDQISVVNEDGSGRRDLLSFPIVLTYSEYNYYPPLFWTGDGGAIRVVIPPEGALDPSPDNTRIWHLPTDGSLPIPLLSTLPVPFFQSPVALSGNGDRAAYMVEITPGSPSSVELHLANVDGSGDMIYATGPLVFHGWAVDGVHFIYTDAGPNPQIGQYGTAPTTLVGVSNLIEVEWVDENRFIYQTKEGPNFKLWMGELGVPGIQIDSTPGGRISFDYGE